MKTVTVRVSSDLRTITMRARNLTSENFAVQVDVTCLTENWRCDTQVASLFELLQRQYEVVEVS